MGREIKFRGIHPVSKVTMDVCVIDWMHDEVYFDQGTDIAHEIDECQLMQYTGLKDRNGVEIYEGDVVQFESGDIDYFFLVSMSDSGCFIAHDQNNILDCYFLDDFDYKVIGSIHQNPELLEK